ncbi:DNA-binding transcriptional ArsR family regulator [Streptacidiphilus sp. MAP12-33]|uniref:hypothetical protein n=1 Tax=Streptacidiphilus sp. MAP12-33 TaxID=3156266 RepID=UPI003518BDB5
MDSEVTVTVQGLSAERVSWWLDRLREVGLVPVGGGRVREQIGRPGRFVARSIPGARQADPGSVR